MDLEIVVSRETAKISEVVLRGRVDLQTAGQLTGAITGLVGEGCQHILLQMRWVRFIDSVGLSALIGLRRDLVRAGGSLRLVHPSPAVSRALEWTHLTGAFEVHEKRDDAVAALVRAA